MKKYINCLLLLLLIVLLPLRVYAVGQNIDPVDGGGSSGSCHGENCYGTGPFGFRVSIVDNNGNLVSGTNAYDYWFSSAEASNRYMSGASYCFKTKNTKKQAINLTNIAANMKICENSFVSVNELGSLGSFSTPQDVEAFVKKIVNMGNSEDAKNNASSSNWIPYNKIFKSINFRNSSGELITIKNITTNDIKGRYLQFEPILAFRNYGTAVNNSIFYGSITEIIKLGYSGGYNNAFGNAVVSLIVKPKYIGVVASAGKSLPSGYYMGVTNKDISSYAQFFAANGTKRYAYGVGFINLEKDIDIPQCNPDADLIVSDYTKFRDKNDKKVSSLLEAWEKLVEKYPAEIKTTFNTGNKINAFNSDVIAIMKGYNGVSAITKKRIGSTTGYPSNSQFAGNRCNVTYECQEIADAIYAKYYSGDKENYEKYITKLQNAFPTHNLLKTKVWTELGYNGPVCNSVNYDCPPTYEKGSCTVANSVFTYSDASKNVCWQTGVAYNFNEDIQSSIYQRMSNGCYTYCYQKATFTFPTDVTNVTKAGTVFKWGIDKNNDVFGTMEVNLTCTVGRPNGTNHNCAGNYTVGKSGLLDVKLLNNDSANTIVKILYDEPSSDLDIHNGNIKTSIVGSSSNADSFKCNDATCSNKPTFNITAKYNLIYSDKKMKWYSSKEDGSLINGTEYVSDNAAFYYEIGYGLPTAFTTATGTYGNNGEMKARLTNPGTKNIANETTKGHFTKLLKKKEGAEYLDYSCLFKVKNELYEDECEYDDAGNLISGSPEYCPEVKDIDVVFRTVELLSSNNGKNEIKIAFPGRNGTSRVIGSNWWNKLKLEDGTEISTDNERKERIAELLNDKVYSEDNILFKITLNSSVIRQIRSYNKDLRKKGINPYTDFKMINSTSEVNTVGYFGFTCYDNDGKKHCASRLVSKLASDGLMTGKCVKGNKRISYNRAKQNINGC